MFKDKLYNWPLVFEVCPPATSKTQEFQVSNIGFLTDQIKYDAINIPEVRKNGKLKGIYPRDFAKDIQENVGIETIVNRVVVHLSREKQQEWILKTHKDYKINNIVLVGGDSSKIKYTGLGVDETNELVSKTLNRGFKYNGSDETIPLENPTDILVGNICIPNRSKVPEHERMLRKQVYGAEFFTTQILYEPMHAANLLMDYEDACKIAGEKPKPVLLSFAPVSTPADLEFLIWLGTRVPNRIKKQLLDAYDDRKMLQKSIDIESEVLDGFFKAVETYDLKVPLGFNVEHVAYHNMIAMDGLTNKLLEVKNEYVS